MKKIVKILGIIALTAVIGFSMTACSDSGWSDGPQKTITVTDIPSNYVGKYGALMLYPPNSSNYTVYSMDTISDTSFKFPLSDWRSDGHNWDGSGSYSINIFIFENLAAATNGTEIYKGKTEIKTIDEEPLDLTIDWSEFTEVTGVRTKNLLHALFQKR